LPVFAEVGQDGEHPAVVAAVDGKVQLEEDVSDVGLDSLPCES
jgi:hypothetical protein